jgi:hypothetical protein
MVRRTRSASAPLPCSSPKWSDASAEGDSLVHLRGGRGCQRVDGERPAAGASRQQAGDVEEVRAEVVAPRRDAVGLIDDELHQGHPDCTAVTLAP